MEKVLFLIGLLPLVIFCLILMIKKKKYLYTISALVLTVCIGAFVCTLPLDNTGEDEVNEEWMNYLVERNMNSGDYEKAAEYLEQLYRACGDTLEEIVARLRLAIMKGDMEQAGIISKEINAYSDKKSLELTEKELKFIEEAAEGEYVSSNQYKLNRAIYESMKENVGNPEDYGYIEVTDKEIEKAEDYEKKLGREIEEAIEDSVDKFEEKRKTKQFAEAWETAEKIEAVSNEDADEQDVNRKLEKYFEELCKLYDKDKDILDVAEIKNAYINACVVLEEYEALVKYADKSNDKNALASLAYLYMTDNIKDRYMEAFDREYDSDDVVSKCEAVYEKMEDGDYSNSELSIYEDYLEAVTSRSDDKILANIEERMAGTLEANSTEVGSYIQCAAINSKLDDKNRVFENLNMAIENKDACEDDTLGKILGKINDIAEKTSDDDEIMNFNNYLAAGYERSLPVDVGEVIVPEEFLNIGNSYINEKRTMINVGNINTEEFPKVQAYISTAGIDLEKKENLEVSDCGVLIKDFTIEKVEYDSAQIVLVCDNSGSMGGDIEVLKSAVVKFIETRSKGEKIGIVTFDSSVLQNTGITKDEDSLMAAVENFGAYGGTNISSGVNEAFGEYDSDKNSYNVMIVMTDGQDSSYYQEQLNNLREKCLDTNVVLYTIGLGDVSAEYLKAIADSGMGSFVYSSNSAQLEELYSFIHNQLDNNYVLTYTAEDTTTKKDRVLTISNKNEGYTASRAYSLEYDEENEDAETMFRDNPDEIYVTKLGVSTIIKGTEHDPAGYEFTILGKNLSKAGNVSVALQGERQYSGLESVTDNDQKITVKLPSDVEYGTYNVLVNIDGTSYTLSKLSIIKAGTKQEISFGDYVFKAHSITESDGLITLAGNVSMNDYLYFYGDITLSGDLEGNILVIGDKEGSYIDGKGILPGLLAKYFDNKIEIPRLDGLTLYKEEDVFDKFYTTGKSYYGPLEIYDPHIEVCPEYLNFTMVDVSFDFPVLNNILDYVDSPIAATGLQNKVVLAKENIGFVLNIESDVSIDKELSFGAAEIELDSFQLAIDTINHDYGLGLAVELDDVPILGNDESTYGFEIGIKSGRFDKFDLGADLDIGVVTLPAGITMVTLSDFHAGVEGMAGEEQDASLASRLLGATFYGQTDVNFFKLNEVIPGLDSILGDILDITILKLDDTTLGLRISDFNISLDTTAVLLEQVELGKVEADLGHYDYENYLLGIDQDVTGIHLKASNDYNLDFGNNFKVNTSGSSQIDVNSAFAGAMVNGNINYNIKFFKRFTGDTEGNCLIGVHNNASQFTVLIKASDYMQGNDAGVRVTFSKGNFLPEVTLY